MDKCFSCGNIHHKVREFPNSKEQEKGEKPSGSSDSPRKNRFHALRTRGEKEASPNMVTGLLQIFAIDVYAFLDLGVTLTFVTHLVVKMLDTLPDV